FCQRAYVAAKRFGITAHVDDLLGTLRAQTVDERGFETFARRIDDHGCCAPQQLERSGRISSCNHGLCRNVVGERRAAKLEAVQAVRAHLVEAHLAWTRGKAELDGSDAAVKLGDHAILSEPRN